MKGESMNNLTNPAIGSSWEDLQSKLFSKEEIVPVTKEQKTDYENE